MSIDKVMQMECDSIGALFQAWRDTSPVLSPATWNLYIGVIDGKIAVIQRIIDALNEEEKGEAECRKSKSPRK